MLIDWFTVGAQVLNFLILVWLLKRFLYRPILDAIDAREQRIAAQLAEAARQKAAATQERDEFLRRNADFEKVRAALLDQATESAKAERQRLLDEAREAATALAEKRREALLDEARTLNQAITQRTRQEVFAIARKTLGDLADTRLEAQIVEVFLARLQAMSATESDDLRQSLQTPGQALIVRSAFGLSAAQLASLENAIKASLGAETLIRFETAPELVSGIELSSDGHKVSWSIAEYLTDLEREVGAMLQPASLSQAAQPGHSADEP